MSVSPLGKVNRVSIYLSIAPPPYPGGSAARCPGHQLATTHYHSNTNGDSHHNDRYYRNRDCSHWQLASQNHTSPPMPMLPGHAQVSFDIPSDADAAGHGPRFLQQPDPTPAVSAHTQQGALAHRPCCHTRRPGRWPQVCGAACPRTTGQCGDSLPCTAVTQSRCSGPGLSPTQSSCSSPELSPAAPMQTEYIVEDMLGLILVGSIMNASNGRHIGRNKYWTSNGPNLGLTIEILLGL